MSTSSGNESGTSAERTIWHHFKQGNQESFALLYKHYFKSLNSYGTRLTGDKQLLEDAIHDVFIELWRRREHLADVENVRFYLFKALRNRIIRSEKNNSIENREDIDNFLDYLVSLSYEDQSIDSENVIAKTQHVQNAIADLSERQREVINLRFYHGLPLDDISRIMGLSKQCVSNLLFKSYAVLRIKLKEFSILAMLTHAFLDCL